MSEKTTERNKRLLGKFILLGVFTSLLGSLFVYLIKQSLRDVIGFAIVMWVICFLSYLSARFKAAERIIGRFFAIWIGFFGSLFITFLPILFFYWLSPFILDRLTTWLQVFVFAIWGLLLILGLLSVATERYRELVLTRLLKLGRLAPVAYSFNLLMIAILFFSSLTYVLANHGALRLNAPSGTKISPEVVRDFYSWNFLQAIPSLKVNETLRWKEPLTYDSGLVGLMLVIFQLLVIVPVIAAFTWFWKQLGKPKKKMSGAPWQYPFPRESCD